MLPDESFARRLLSPRGRHPSKQRFGSAGLKIRVASFTVEMLAHAEEAFTRAISNEQPSRPGGRHRWRFNQSIIALFKGSCEH